ncbi:hypothetical protein PEC18_20965 [Paucibacter sp. O1-1]|uniref:hypothetical protein n=1 Tax=Paucibacter sp. M5-1 TaxID=3015998 RepID=UPI0021D4FE0B|nr:hypothetical protein [Paucibacter sp. M5-1]MCU7373226.1 hypothetical protein [Paucibacter sp. O1-1]MCZ7879523.1 hypothetical protein [Paucibacter sp. M5-1]MDA3828225.1 hypothetical protein [Paucibacter sp. O1-1]
MTAVQHLAALTALELALALAASCAYAQFVKGNEAVGLNADGTARVETPPLPKATLGKPCPATNPACTASGWRMLETKDGLRECTEFYARPGTCRASTYGIEQRPRRWIVKSKGLWLQCERPDLGSRCISLSALPNTVIQ